MLAARRCRLPCAADFEIFSLQVTLPSGGHRYRAFLRCSSLFAFALLQRSAAAVLMPLLFSLRLFCATTFCLIAFIF